MSKKKYQWENTSKVWIVNGQINKLDANFRMNFNYSKIGDTGLYVGTNPLQETEIQRLSREGISAVFCLNEVKDDAYYFNEIYGKNGIFCVYNFHIPELNKLSDIVNLLLEAAQQLNNLFENQNHKKIYLHCNSGMTRAPTVAIVFLCLFCKVKCWQNPVEVYKLFKSYRSTCFPNMKAVLKTVSRNPQF
jgi:protein-tyrosine phosphatase